MARLIVFLGKPEDALTALAVSPSFRPSA